MFLRTAVYHFLDQGFDLKMSNCLMALFSGGYDLRFTNYDLRGIQPEDQPAQYAR